MGFCLLVAGQKIALASAVFTLGWTHSVEKTAWREHWRLDGPMLVLEEARIRGSGAGMEPGTDARLEDGWWIWPVGTRHASVRLAASGATRGGWQLCADGNCREIGRRAGAAVEIASCSRS